MGEELWTEGKGKEKGKEKGKGKEGKDCIFYQPEQRVRKEPVYQYRDIRNSTKNFFS